MSTFNELVAQIGDNPQIRAFGTKADYAPDTTHKDIIYFTTDTQDILLNGKSYGGAIPKFTSQEILTKMRNNSLGDFPIVKVSFKKYSEEDYLEIPSGSDFEGFTSYFDTPKDIYFYRTFEDSSREYGYVSFSSYPRYGRGEPYIFTCKGNRSFMVSKTYLYDSEEYKTVQAAKSFLEATDPGNNTINKWKELEAFLAGITDTQTLTGLLQNVQTAAAADAAAKVKAVQDAFDEYKTQMNTVLNDIYRIIGTEAEG